MKDKLFFDRESARKLVGLTERQFSHAVTRLGLRPFTFPRVMHSTKQFWVRQVLLDNKAALIACTGQAGRPKCQGARPPRGPKL